MKRVDYERFTALRKKVMSAIEEQLKIDDGCKSYEGTFEWTVEYPNYFEDPDATLPPSFYSLTLHCYVLGPARHYDWTGDSISKVLDKAEKTINGWLEGH